MPKDKRKLNRRAQSDFDMTASASYVAQGLLERLLDEDGLFEIGMEWEHRARPEQLPPPGDWHIWLVMAGRGFGKTRMGAEWVRGIAERDGSARIALIGASLHEARSVMVEGESGVMTVAPPWLRPVWRPYLRQLHWPNGASATIFGAADAETLRGPQHSHIWADEIAKWQRGTQAWDNAMMGLRLGNRPRALATTTPRPVALVRRLLDQKGIVVTRGRTLANRTALPAAFLEAILRDYGGTRLGRQELDGELLLDAEGALWTRDLIEGCRVRSVPGVPNAGDEPLLGRVVIGVDPPAGSEGDACGIIVAGTGADGRAYVIDDASVERSTPEQWARAVAHARHRWGADRVVAEANNGGAMVASVLRAAEVDMPVRLVHASRGKSARAEPVAALYERGRVRHVGMFERLEDEMCGLLVGGGYAGPGRSPDRADALVWVLTELLLKSTGIPKLRVA